MKWKQRITENRRPGVIGAVFVIFLGFAGLSFPALTRLSFDLPVVLRPRASVNEAVIVYIDEESTAALRQPFDQPWDRSLHTRLVEQLTKASAKAVVFDMLFDVARDPQVDRDFANAMATHGKVVVAASMDLASGPGFAAAKPILPVEPIASATRYGFAEMPLESDGIVRKYCSSADNNPSLPEKAAEIVGALPGRPEQQRWLNYYGPAGVIPHVSYYQALDTNLPGGLFAGKTVFVGHATLHTPVGTRVGISTPYTRWTGGHSPGVEIQATAFLNLVRKDWLTRLPIEAGLIIAVGLVFGCGLTLLRSWIVAVVVAIAGVLAVAGSAMTLFWQMHIWFSWLVVCAVQIPGAFAWFLYAQRDRRLSQEAEALTPSGDYFAA